MDFTSTRPQILSKDDLRRLAPAIFAEHPSPKVSSKYTFVPTTEVVDTLANKGFYPVRVDVKRSRKEENKGFGTHVIRFRHEDLRETLVGDSLFELVLKTAHDLTSAFDFSAGLWRLLCSNGLVAPAGQFGAFNVKHVGYANQDVRNGLDQMLNALPALRAVQSEMAATALEQDERLLLAESASSLRWGDKSPLRESAQLLVPRRRGDQGMDLWTTFNVLQENMVRGGIVATGTTGRRYRTKQLRNAGESVRLNRELWKLTEHFGKLKRGEVQPSAAVSPDSNDVQS